MARVTVSDDEVDKLVAKATEDLAQVLDLEFPVEIEMGSCRMTVSRLLELKPGDRVALNRLSTEYPSLSVGGIQIGAAEVLQRKGRSAARLVRIS